MVDLKRNRYIGKMKKEKRKIRLKYIVAGVLIALFACGYLFDFLWAKTYRVEIVSVSDEEPLASEKDKVDIVVKVTHFGKPMAGHEMFALPDAGRMLNYNAVTDENGFASFTYIPFNGNPYMTIEEVRISIRDESNSVIWEVNAYGYVSLRPRTA